MATACNEEFALYLLLDLEAGVAIDYERHSRTAERTNLI